MNGAQSAFAPYRHLPPFVGWRPFNEADTERFFGRDREAHSLWSTWQDNRLVVLHGPSASGKTSLLRAGVLPLLRIGLRALVLPVARLSIPGSSERPSSARLTGPGTSALFRTWGYPGLRREPGRSLADLLISHLESRDVFRNPLGVMAAIDQFEEIFTLSREERSSTFRSLAEALRNVPQLKLLLVINDECIEDFKSRDATWGVPPTYFELKDLSYDAALAAVTRPLVNIGLAFGEGVAEELVDQLCTFSNRDGMSVRGSAVPALVRPLLLQLLCYQVWSGMKPEEGTVTFDLLHTASNVEEALRRFYDDVVAEVCFATGQHESEVRAWIESKFITPSGEARVIRRGTKLTAEAPNDVVDAFVAMHILKIERQARTTWCRIDSDRLAGAIAQANIEWRTAFGESSPQHDPTADTPAAYIDSAQDALCEGDVVAARRLAALAVDWYRRSGEERRLAHGLMLQGDIALAQGDLGSAEVNFQATLAHFTFLQDRNQIAHALSKLGELHSYMGNYGTAAEFQQLAIDYLPTDINALVGLGYAQWYEGFPADADATFTRALAWQPDSAAALAGRGQVRAEMQEYTVALSDLSHALAVGLSAEDEIDAMTARALALTGLGRTAEGEHELSNARARAPHRARTLFRAAHMAAMKGQAELAAYELQQGLASGPPVSSREETNARKVVRKLGFTPD